jgi:Glycoside hydrolase family 44/Secretion system C-terminal sorting domain
LPTTFNMKHLTLFALFFALNTTAQVTVTVDPTKDIKPISPYIYGRNNSLPKESYAKPLTAAQLVQLKESGVRMLREGGGNNSTKYNWRKRLSSHPDWYNNVYVNDWDVSVKTLRDEMPANVQGLWSFQLIGKAAKTDAQNFGDWAYNRSQWWEGTAQNLAGGGQLQTTGTKAKVEGNPDAYLENWPADSTVGILDYWMKDLNIPKNRIEYWSMDNEPEIWNGTHDDIVAPTLQAEAFMQSYFAVAKKAKAKFPTIKLVGPVTANEWQWYNWMNTITGADGKTYTWLEFFIKRCAEEQKASGVRLLDVLDIHFYPNENTAEQIVQMHRIFFDRTYVYAGANGVRKINGGWDVSQNKEYIFARLNDWMNQYFGQNHGIKLGLTEMDVASSTPSVLATWYASMMGEFMKNEVELFTPWSWKTGMWETLHLFARYNQTLSVQGTSTDETFVSSYPSINATKDSMTIVLVNRSATETKTTSVNFANFTVKSTTADVRTLKSLPTTETFVSHTQNGISQSIASINNNTTTLSLAPLSVTSFTVKGNLGSTPTSDLATDNDVLIYPNPIAESFKIELKTSNFDEFSIFDALGRVVLHQKILPSEKIIDIKNTFPAGIYSVVLTGAKNRVVKKIIAL